MAAVALLCAAGSGWAQDYPSRAISFVVPFTPGTTADSLARLLQPHLSQRWGVPVVVENKPGAGLSIAFHPVRGAIHPGHGG